MATDVTARLQVKLDVTEKSTSLGSALKTSSLQHLINYVKVTVNGTTDASHQQDLVYSEQNTATASANTLDVAASLTSKLTGAAVTMVEVTAICVVNKSTTSGEVLIIGAGSNPLLNWVNATGDAVKVGASGVFLITSPLNGYAVTATTGDILTIDPGAATISYDIILLGRSA